MLRAAEVIGMRVSFEDPLKGQLFFANVVNQSI
jgi:hypothetical protein